MKSYWSAKLLFLLLGLSVPVELLAQRAPQRFISTIDVRVLNADTVVVGKVGNIVRLEPDRANGAIDFTVVVGETLKGSPQSQLRRHIGLGNLNEKKEIAEMLKNKTDVLLIGDSFLGLKTKGLSVPAANGAQLREPDSVVDYVRGVLRDHANRSRVETFLVPVPREWDGSSNAFSGFGSVTGVVVPVDAQLEKWAIEAIESSANFLSRYQLSTDDGYQSEQLRILGIQALQLFRSEQNISLLKGLLTDSAFDSSRPEHNNGVETRTYRIRQKAHEALKKWGLEVSEPVLIEEIARFDTVEMIRWKGAIADSDLQKLTGAAKLKDLQLVGNSVGDSRLAMIGRIRTLTRLTIREPITDIGLRHLQGLANLEELDLSTSRVSDRGLADVAGHLPKLKRLVLLETRISDDALAALTALKNLKYLDVTLTQTTKEGVARARRTRPDLVIERSFRDNATGPGERLAADVFAGDLKSIVRDFDEFRINPNSVDPGGTPAIFYAIAQKRADIVELLLDRKARVDIRDSGNSTPLQWATRHRYTGIMKVLIDRGANVNLADPDGNTALHFAARNGSAEEIRLLVNSGADASLRNRDGHTPVDLARNSGANASNNLLLKLYGSEQNRPRR
jgi:hypothetical protein